MNSAANAPATSSGFAFDRMSFPICRVFGVPIRVHIMLPLVAGLAALSAGLSGAGAWGIVFAIVVNGPLLLLTVWCHEMGHVTAARRCGFLPDHILLWPLGGLAYISKEGITPKEQIFVSVSGPLTHIPMFGIWVLIGYLTNGFHFTMSTDGMWYSTHFAPLMCIFLMINNIAMFLFNLLVPCIPLDCSQILISVLLLCGMEPSGAAGVMVCLSVPVVLCLVGFGIWLFASGNYMASMTIIMGLWLGVQTYRLHQARKNGQLAFMPLFAQAMTMGTGTRQQTSEERAAPSGRSAGAFKPFEGRGHILGKSGSEENGTSNEVCLASLVAFGLNVLLMARLTQPSSLAP